MLNVQSQFDTAELRKVKKRPLDHNLGITPTKLEALGKMKNVKAPGSSEILPAQ